MGGGRYLGSDRDLAPRKRRKVKEQCVVKRGGGSSEITEGGRYERVAAAAAEAHCRLEAVCRHHHKSKKVQVQVKSQVCLF